jgi:serine O-acetyltransferase
MSSHRWRASSEQLGRLRADLERMVNHRHWRWLTVWTSAAAHGLIAYRISRALYLLLGARSHAALRILFSPALLLLQPWVGRCEIHFEADLGPGVKILHPSLGVVISKFTRCGRNLTLTGGNCIGMRRKDATRIVLGDSVLLGANAVVLGPARLGSRVSVGAGAVAMTDAPDGAVLVGVPARPVSRTPARPDEDDFARATAKVSA